MLLIRFLVKSLSYIFGYNNIRLYSLQFHFQMYPYYLSPCSTTYFNFYPTYFVFPAIQNISNISSLNFSTPSNFQNYCLTKSNDQFQYKYLKASTDDDKSNEKQYCPQSMKIDDQKESILQKLTIDLDNRNILPSIVNVILCYVRRRSKSEKVVTRIISYFGTENIKDDVGKFYAYQDYLKNNAHEFINRMAIHNLMDYHIQKNELFTFTEQQRFNRVFRVLVRYYLRNQHLLYSTGSPKMTSSKRNDNLKINRFLIQVLSGHPRKSNQQQKLQI